MQKLIDMSWENPKCKLEVLWVSVEKKPRLQMKNLVTTDPNINQDMNYGFRLCLNEGVLSKNIKLLCRGNIYEGYSNVKVW